MREIVINSAALCHGYALRIAGALCMLSTNAPRLGATLRRWRTDDTNSASDFSMQVRVSPGNGAAPIPPHFRGLKHLVVASFGEENVFAFDLVRRRVTATVSADMADDKNFWNRILLPIAIGVLGPAVGVVPVHSACVMIDGAGVLIAGASGVGKSTLSVALARRGFTYLSDDWTYLTSDRGRLLAHGMGIPAKLLPDAIKHFSFLNSYPVGIALNQELAYELPAQEIGAKVEYVCEPQWFLFLERSTESGCRVAPVSGSDARLYIEHSVERLPAELDDMVRTRSSVIDQISQLSCWKLTYGGSPQVAVSALQEFLARQRQGALG